MLFPSLFHRPRCNARPNHEGRPAKPRPRYLPRLETLEDRTVPSYVFRTIDDPLGVFYETASGINARGQVVGSYADANYHFHGFLLSSGRFTNIDVPGAGQTFATGINDRGQIVGSYVDAHGLADHGFLLSGGRYTTLDDPAASEAFPDTEPRGISNEGEIVGAYYDADCNEHAFLLSGGQYTTIDPPNSSGLAAEANGVNARGQIVGSFVDTNFKVHGFLLSGGEYTNLDDPNGVDRTGAYGINASGQIVGFFYRVVNFSHGFLLKGGEYTTLDDPNGGSGRFLGTFVNGINDAGTVVGVFTDSNNQQHAFLATPTQGNGAKAGIDIGSDAPAFGASSTIIGGNGWGGAVSVLGGSLSNSDSTLYKNLALGGSAGTGGVGGDGLGGGPNGNWASPTDTYGGTGPHLYRLFGDVNVDGVVDATDLGLLKQTFNRNSTDPLYPWYLDADNSGSVDATDVSQFKLRFKTNVF
jgi:probable HAF family extracellular repeat protein